jgi:hypothetical protein
MSSGVDNMNSSNTALLVFNDMSQRTHLLLPSPIHNKCRRTKSATLIMDCREYSVSRLSMSVNVKFLKA